MFSIFQNHIHMVCIVVLILKNRKTHNVRSLAKSFRKCLGYIYIAFFIFPLIFRTSGPNMAIFRGKIGKGMGRYWPPTKRNRSYTLAGLHLCVKFGENRQRNATMRVMTHGHTHTQIDRQIDKQRDRDTDSQTDANWFYYLFHAICYSYGADNYKIRRRRRRKCNDLKCVRKPTKSRLSLTHHANKSSRWAE